jgi:hypothetical protein
MDIIDCSHITKCSHRNRPYVYNADFLTKSQYILISIYMSKPNLMLINYPWRLDSVDVLLERVFTLLLTAVNQRELWYMNRIVLAVDSFAFLRCKGTHITLFCSLVSYPYADSLCFLCVRVRLL